MRRLAKVAVLAGIAALVGRTLIAKIKPHERLMARCERMFKETPEDFPPKRILRGIDEIRADTARTRELLEQREAEATGASSSAGEVVNAT